MKRVFIVASLMSLGWIGTVVGKTNQTESVLDRIVTEQPNGGPFVLTPPLPYWSEGIILSVGRAAGIVVGFEALPDVKYVGDIASDQIAADIKTRRRISLGGKTVREALDTIVAIDPRYRWLDIHGVPVVRPWASWTDPAHPLNQVVAPVAWKDIDLATASAKVMALVTRTDGAGGPVPGSGRGPKFTIETGPIAVQELLNAIGVAHGGPVGWYMRHNCTTAHARAIYIHLQAYDGDQLWGLGTCRPVSLESRQPQ
jgi:hypothetical protein